jgi:galactose-6-phosphate isomerase
MRIAIGCDHIVTGMKNDVRDYLIGLGHDVIDVGTYDNTRTHYPIYGQKIGELVASGMVDIGVAICGTGVGISNSAQKVKGTRVALVSDILTARKAKEDFNANIISFGGRVVGMGTATEIIDSFLDAAYKGFNEEMIKHIDTLGNDSRVSFSDFLKRWDEGEYTD